VPLHSERIPSMLSSAAYFTPSTELHTPNLQAALSSSEVIIEAGVCMCTSLELSSISCVVGQNV